MNRMFSNTLRTLNAKPNYGTNPLARRTTETNDSILKTYNDQLYKYKLYKLYKLLHSKTDFEFFFYTTSMEK